ncbi:unnamed protein product [Closterium sp. NIES-54]
MDMPGLTVGSSVARFPPSPTFCPSSSSSELNFFPVSPFLPLFLSFFPSSPSLFPPRFSRSLNIFPQFHPPLPVHLPFAFTDVVGSAIGCMWPSPSLPFLSLNLLPTLPFFPVSAPSRIHRGGGISHWLQCRHLPLLPLPLIFLSTNPICLSSLFPLCLSFQTWWDRQLAAVLPSPSLPAGR